MFINSAGTGYPPGRIYDTFLVPLCHASGLGVAHHRWPFRKGQKICEKTCQIMMSHEMREYMRVYVIFISSIYSIKSKSEYL